MIPLTHFKNIHLVGLSSVEGTAIARFLKQQNIPFIAHDFSWPEKFADHFSEAHLALPHTERKPLLSLILNAPQKIYYRNDYLQGIEHADAICVSQNWKNYPQNHPLLSNRKKAQVPFITLMELYFRFSPAPICGVSGTNGKTTTVNWLRHFLSPEIPCLQGGNDLFHPQCLHRLNELTPNHYLLLEISNRQLEWLDDAPYLGILTNIAEDHLEEHGSFEAYAQVKKKLVQHAKIAILNYEDPQVRSFGTEISGQVYYYGFSPELSIYLQEGTLFENLSGTPRPLVKTQEMILQGKHQLLDGMAAALSALLLGASFEKVCSGLKSFTGVRNRTQKIATLAGITYINDMACTSPHAALAALDSIEEPIHLICGGDHKGADFTLLNKRLSEKACSLYLLPGTLSEKLQHPQKKSVSSLQEAVQLALQQAKPGESVLLSPIGSGFFSQHIRGQEGFPQLVKRLFREQQQGLPANSNTFSCPS